LKPVLIVEDHPLVADAMSEALSRSVGDLEPFICFDASNARAAMSDRDKHWFRIFLDLDVPGARGLSLAREFHSHHLQARCCVVSGFDRADLIDEVRELGFLGYIVKATASAEFAQALSAVVAGERSFPALNRAANHLAMRLTRRQEDLLDCLRRGMSSKETAVALFLSEGTVNNGITAAMKALEVTNRTHAVSKAIDMGLLGPHMSDLPVRGRQPKRVA
jgi:DNA-binding NarL/FixJ family response regulator